MSNTDQFINTCQLICAEHKSQDTNYQVVGRAINRAAGKLRGDVHPMITAICTIAFDLAEDLLQPDVAQAEWTRLQKLAQDYVSGNWAPTQWILMASYNLAASNRVTQSFGLKVTVNNSSVVIEIANVEIRKWVETTAKRVNKCQTDERFLQNLAHLLPNKIGELRFAAASVSEHLIASAI